MTPSTLARYISSQGVTFFMGMRRIRSEAERRSSTSWMAWSLRGSRRMLKKSVSRAETGYETKVLQTCQSGMHAARLSKGVTYQNASPAILCTLAFIKMSVDRLASTDRSRLDCTPNACSEPAPAPDGIVHRPLAEWMMVMR